MLVVIDYGVGNLGSILNMLKRIKADAKISSDARVIEKADKLILPGVGAFDAAMSALNSTGLIPLLNEKVLKDNTPVLGVCLGMQLLTASSEEGKLPGLGWVEGKTVKFKFPKNSGLKIPHMGWNTVKIVKEYPLLQNMPEDPRFYFVHSYHVECKNPGDVAATTHYGYDFPSVISKGNIYGAQFHPEKSHKFGMKLYENFVKS
ncbi:MAG: imidazole glycerol phosphate synthase subunit HisH [Candidatus Norongarragalinales archaeon]